MNNLSIYSKFLSAVIIYVFSAALFLTGATALAQEDNETLLEHVGDLLQNAKIAAMQAKASGDGDLSKVALQQANTAAGLLLGLADVAQKTGDTGLALVTLNMAGQTSNVISDVLSVSTDTADAFLTSTALNVAEQTNLLISNIATMAQQTDNPPLAQAALNAANNTRAVIVQVTDTARVVAQISPDRISVQAAERVVEKSETVVDLNTQAVSTALATGASDEAEGFEPEDTAPPTFPVLEQPPILDLDPASAV